MTGTVKNIVCVCPVYDDWESFSILRNNLERLFADRRRQFSVKLVAVDDGSIEEYKMVHRDDVAVPTEIVNLRSNVGHQRAIAIGLQYVNANYRDFDFVVVLDSDGEDRPEDIIALVEACDREQSGKIVFAQRKRRQESLFFRLSYSIYKL